MIELNKVEMQAIKTARLSAQKERLKPKTKFFCRLTELPEKTTGISERAKIKGIKAKRKAKRFLALPESLAKTGRMNAPKRGRKIIISILVSGLIKLKRHSLTRVSRVVSLTETNYPVKPIT